jgi:HPt (histidine-containing phosphotransfer) domain-containing protein
MADAAASRLQSQETTNARTEDRFIRTEDHFERIEEKLDDLRRAHALEVAEIKDQLKALLKDKDKALLWGITALGAVVMALGTALWNYIAPHQK